MRKYVTIAVQFLAILFVVAVGLCLIPLAYFLDAPKGGTDGKA